MRWKPFLIGWVIGGICLGGIFFLLFCFSRGAMTRLSFRPAVAVITVEGEIILADDLVEQIEEARTSDGVKAAVLRINSPGGSVGASQEIYQALLSLAKEKPLVASMGNVAASGGYYIACAAREIFAMPGTITGSIGVRMEHVNIGELLRWARVTPETLKSGAMKDTGSPYRPLSAPERALLQDLLVDMHAQFKEAVATGRHLEPATVDQFADGRVLTGRQAMALQLVDAYGGLPEAVKSAATFAGITGEPRVIEIDHDRPWWLELLVEDAEGMARRIGQLISASLQRPGIGYRLSF